MRYYSIHEFSKLINRTPQTLRNWDKSSAITENSTIIDDTNAKY